MAVSTGKAGFVTFELSLQPPEFLFSFPEVLTVIFFKGMDAQ